MDDQNHQNDDELVKVFVENDVAAVAAEFVVAEFVAVVAAAVAVVVDAAATDHWSSLDDLNVYFSY